MINLLRRTHQIQQREMATQTDSNDIAASVFRYGSLVDLRTQWQALDRSDCPQRATVILMLDDRFAGHIPSLIARENYAPRLLIIAPSGRLPGATSIGDLALHASRYGWDSIEVYRGLEEAELPPAERCVMFRPDWA